MRSRYISSTFGRKFLTENGFSDIDFLHNVEILAARRCFSPISAILLYVRSFGHIITFGLNFDDIFEFRALVFL